MSVEGKRLLAICLFLSLLLASGLLAAKVVREAHMPTKKGTILSITPSNFTAGDSLHPLTATLTDTDGNPVWGKEIVWSVTLGTLSPSTEKITNTFGQITVEYRPALVDVETPTRIVAEFVGDKWYDGSQGFADVTIVPGTPPPPEVKTSREQAIDILMRQFETEELEYAKIVVAKLTITDLPPPKGDTHNILVWWIRAVFKRIDKPIEDAIDYYLSPETGEIILAFPLP